MILQEHELWTFNLNKKTWKINELQNFYPGLETGVRGGVTTKENITYFFKSKFSQTNKSLNYSI